jgi:nicotinamide-nucleotide amidase
MTPDPRSSSDAVRLHQRAAEALRALRAGGHTLAVAESLTGGLLAASLTGVPGASAVFRGGVTAYATDTKTTLLAVPETLVRSVGVVSGQVAAAMAAGVRDRLGSTYALGTTGVAGPDAQEGRPVGTVFVAVAGPAEADVLALTLDGDRQEIRVATCLAALDLLGRTLGTGAASADR